MFHFNDIMAAAAKLQIHDQMNLVWTLSRTLMIVMITDDDVMECLRSEGKFEQTPIRDSILMFTLCSLVYVCFP